MENRQKTNRISNDDLDALESFVDRQIEDMDESGQWSTHAINALLELQARFDERLRKMRQSEK